VLCGIGIGIVITIAWFFFLAKVQTTIQVQRLEPNTTPTTRIRSSTVSSAGPSVVLVKLVLLPITVVLMIVLVVMCHGPKTIDKVSGFDGRPAQIQDLQTSHRSNAFLDDGRWAGRPRNTMVATRIRIRIRIRIGIRTPTRADLVCIGIGIRACVLSRNTTTAGFCCKSLATRVAFLVEQAGWKRKGTVRQGSLVAMVSF